MAGVEIANGTYNSTYIETALELVNMAGEYGIYSLLDAHQDVLSAALCGEVGVSWWCSLLTTMQGIPNWATKPKKNNFPEVLLRNRYEAFTHVCVCSRWARPSLLIPRLATRRMLTA
jgi:hypothetical protein